MYLRADSAALADCTHRDADREQRQRDAGQQHQQPPEPARRRKRRLHDPGQAQGRADHRQSRRRQELHYASLDHAGYLTRAATL